MNVAAAITYLIADGGMGAAIAQKINGQYAFLFAAIAFVVTLAMLFEYYRHRHSKWTVFFAALLTLTHPIWTVSATSGDLGYGQRDLAFIWTAVVVVLFFAMYFRQPNRYNSETSVSRRSQQNVSAG
jgi:4-hydroxybenzoate polyprenyltransferase